MSALVMGAGRYVRWPLRWLMSVMLAALAADLWMCIADPHRLGHERTYYPGCVNFRAADVIIINKANTAKPVSSTLLAL